MSRNTVIRITTWGDLVFGLLAIAYAVLAIYVLPPIFAELASASAAMTYAVLALPRALAGFREAVPAWADFAIDAVATFGLVAWVVAIRWWLPDLEVLLSTSAASTFAVAAATRAWAELQAWLGEASLEG